MARRGDRVTETEQQTGWSEEQTSSREEGDVNDASLSGRRTPERKLSFACDCYMSERTGLHADRGIRCRTG